MRTQKIKYTSEDRLIFILIIIMFLALFTAIVLPLFELLLKSIQDKNGVFVGCANFLNFFTTENTKQALFNTINVSIFTTVISVVLGFLYSYGLTRRDIKFKAIFRLIYMLPLFAPTMMHGIGLIYLFGNKGVITTGFFGTILPLQIELYGPIGIIIAEVIYTFPQVVMIMSVSLMFGDKRLYDAAESLGSSKIRTFFTVTLPSVKYGLLSSIIVAFTLSFTDFGAPKVVGGMYNVLAVDIYKQVIGQQNFSMGATISLVLLFPAIASFIVDRIIQKRQSLTITSKAKPLTIKSSLVVDSIFFIINSIIAGAILIVNLIVLYASFVKNWPYKFTLSLSNYNFDGFNGGYEAYFNSLRMSFYTAFFGTIIVFMFAYLIEKGQKIKFLRSTSYMLSLIPLALPGLVIGIAYIFFFNKPEFNILGFNFQNPFHFLYGTMAILVISNIVHFYSVSFMTATSALKKLDKEYETVSKSMGVPFYKTFFKVTAPLSFNAITEIAIYFFVNSMVTVSAVIFLYSSHLKLASISVVDMEDAGDTQQAAAMSILILITNIIIKIIYSKIISRKKEK
ncbi:MAG: putative 2-aminoethylphosphonate ABC transporter permease subunit [Candidatus Delongbacteria bacterium]|nr:putative 2-aminoethylphosphonate ABC transporter permease subunit [Candidatus Delongbacteria bacterium]MBN2834384.1 putative 2-aminoethylphosphonate ABC transporter permease subunit [Candidatus Delongbacteria bacterium]